MADMKKPNQCMALLNQQADKCLIRGAGGETYAHLPCIARIESNQPEAFNDCKKAMGLYTNKSFDLYSLDMDRREMRNCNASYENCCMSHDNPNLFESKSSYQNYHRPVCPSVMTQGMQEEGFLEGYQNKARHAIHASYSASHEDQASLSRFRMRNDKFFYDGSSALDSVYGTGCFYSENGDAVAAQCDMDKKSAKCAANLDKCGKHGGFVLVSENRPERQRGDGTNSNKLPLSDNETDLDKRFQNKDMTGVRGMVARRYIKTFSRPGFVPGATDYAGASPDMVSNLPYIAPQFGAAVKVLLNRQVDENIHHCSRADRT